jgi:hypothetical protein
LFPTSTFAFLFFSFCNKKTKLQLFDFILHIFSKWYPWLELEKNKAIEGHVARTKRELIVDGSKLEQEDSHAIRGRR